MPSNQAKLLAVLEVLRAAGPDVPAGDLLRLAAHISKAALTEPDELAGFGRPGESRPFLGLPCDEAMEDGGWRVLAFEGRQDGGLDNLDFDELEHLESRLESLLGPLWQHRTQQE